MMRIRIGYELTYECPQPTPMILTLNIHYSRVSDLVTPDHIVTSPPIPITAYRDGFGNWCSRIIAPPGETMRICAFLWVYYGYPASDYEGINVEVARNRCGAALARAEWVAGLEDLGPDRFASGR